MLKNLKCLYIVPGLVCVFLFNTLGLNPVEAEELALPQAVQPRAVSTVANLPILKGIKVNSASPFKFEFVMDANVMQKGAGPFNAFGDLSPSIKIETNKLIKYFLASLTIHEKDLWVNLSPYEKNRIVPDAFGQTEMGRDLLAQDYVLKQITASLMNPEGEVGKEFWKKVYAEAAKRGISNVPISTFNKVWIVPEKAVVYENAKAGTAYVVESTLKVLTEEDYVAIEKSGGAGDAKADSFSARRTMSEDRKGAAAAGPDRVASQMIREVVIPELTHEVNEGQHFAQLRQVYNSLILATWYKKKIKDSILNQVYSNKNKISGVGYQKGAGPFNAFGDLSPSIIYQQYLTAFKKGAYNLIKEEQDPITKQMIPRKYFSGGASLMNINLDYAMASQVHDGQPEGLVSFGLDLTMNAFDKAMLQQQVVEDVNKGIGFAYIKKVLNELVNVFINTKQENRLLAMKRLKDSSVLWKEDSENGIYFQEEIVDDSNGFGGKFQQGDKILKLHLDGVDKDKLRAIINEALSIKEYARMKQLGYRGIYANTGNKGIRVLFLRCMQDGIEINTPFSTRIKTFLTGKYGQWFYGYPKSGYPMRVVFSFDELSKQEFMEQLNHLSDASPSQRRSTAMAMSRSDINLNDYVNRLVDNFINPVGIPEAIASMKKEYGVDVDNQETEILLVGARMASLDAIFQRIQREKILKKDNNASSDEVLDGIHDRLMKEVALWKRMSIDEQKLIDSYALIGEKDIPSKVAFLAHLRLLVKMGRKMGPLHFLKHYFRIQYYPALAEIIPNHIKHDDAQWQQARRIILVQDTDAAMSFAQERSMVMLRKYDQLKIKLGQVLGAALAVSNDKNERPRLERALDRWREINNINDLRTFLMIFNNLNIIRTFVEEHLERLRLSDEDLMFVAPGMDTILPRSTKLIGDSAQLTNIEQGTKQLREEFIRNFNLSERQVKTLDLLGVDYMAVLMAGSKYLTHQARGLGQEQLELRKEEAAQQENQSVEQVNDDYDNLMQAVFAKLRERYLLSTMARSIAKGVARYYAVNGLDTLSRYRNDIDDTIHRALAADKKVAVLGVGLQGLLLIGSPQAQSLYLIDHNPFVIEMLNEYRSLKQSHEIIIRRDLALDDWQEVIDQKMDLIVAERVIHELGRTNYYDNDTEQDANIEREIFWNDDIAQRSRNKFWTNIQAVLGDGGEVLIEEAYVDPRIKTGLLDEISAMKGIDGEQIFDRKEEKGFNRLRIRLKKTADNAQLDVKNAELVPIIEMTRKKSDGSPLIDEDEENFSNYMKNQNAVRKKFLEMVVKLKHDKKYDLERFKKDFIDLNIVLLTGENGQSIYKTPTMKLEEIPSSQIPKIAGKFRSQVSAEEIIKVLYEDLRLFFSEHFNKSYGNINDKVYFLGKIYYKFLRNEFVFKYGNNALIMNVINALLRLLGLNGISHSNMDTKLLLDFNYAAFDERLFNEVAKSNPLIVGRDIRKTSDSAQLVYNGGIDLTRADRSLTVNHDSAPALFQFDPVQMTQWQEAPGVTFTINNVRPVENISQWLGA